MEKINQIKVRAMKLFELLQNDLTYAYLDENLGNDGRIHLDYEVSGLGSTCYIRYELCIYTSESCGVIFNDLGTADAGLGNERYLEQLIADRVIIENMLNNMIRSGTIV